jgi:hypothetical protein
VGYYYDRDTIAAKEPFPAPPVDTDSAKDAYEHVLKDAGATRPARDSVDARVVDDVRDGTGHLVNSVTEAGGWPDFPTVDSIAKSPQEKTR